MKSYIAEFVGTFLFLYVILVSKNAFVIGLALSFIIILSNKFTSGHFNPAVTIMMVASGTHPKNKLLPFCLAQIAGGLTALELFKKINT